jgi:phosphatidylethanolamine-binding protein (PEBP) family uncharacterized protein
MSQNIKNIAMCLLALLGTAACLAASPGGTPPAPERTEATRQATTVATPAGGVQLTTSAPLAATLTATTAAEAGQPAPAAGFTLRSPDVVGGGALPSEYTCDGASATLPLVWSGAPAGTMSYALIMYHVASPTDIHWYWVLYDIPATVTSLAKNSTGIGTLGSNSVNKQTAYTPPCSKGPGDKVYIYEVYALSAAPQLTLPAAQVDRDALLAAIQPVTLASAELRVTYARK